MLSGHVLAKAQFSDRGAPTEWEVNAEVAYDFRGPFTTINENLPAEIPVADGTQNTLSPAIGLSYMRRVTNLRAYYGLRLEGHSADWEGTEDFGAAVSGSTYSAAALVTYKAFIFDMEGDCDCPRWEKSNFFKKAFFIDFGAGYGRQGWSRDGSDDRADRGGIAYMARLGLAVRMKKQWDLFLAGGAHGLIGEELFLGRHDIAVRPALGFTWRPYYNRF